MPKIYRENCYYAYNSLIDELKSPILKIDIKNIKAITIFLLVIYIAYINKNFISLNSGNYFIILIYIDKFFISNI